MNRLILKSTWPEQMAHENALTVERYDTDLFGSQIQTWFHQYPLDVQEKLITTFSLRRGSSFSIEHHKIEDLLSSYNQHSRVFSDEEIEYLQNKSALALSYYTENGDDKSATNWLLLYIRTHGDTLPDHLPIDPNIALRLWVNDRYSSSKDFLLEAMQSSHALWYAACWKNVHSRDMLLSHIGNDIEPASYFGWQDDFLEQLDNENRELLLSRLAIRWMKKISTPRTTFRQRDKHLPFSLSDCAMASPHGSKTLLSFLLTHHADWICSSPEYLAAFVLHADRYPELITNALLQSQRVSSYRYLFFSDRCANVLKQHALLQQDVSAEEAIRLFSTGFLKEEHRTLYGTVLDNLLPKDVPAFQEWILHEPRCLRVYPEYIARFLNNVSATELLQWYHDCSSASNSAPAEKYHHKLQYMMHFCAENIRRGNPISKSILLDIQELCLLGETYFSHWDKHKSLSYNSVSWSPGEDYTGNPLRNETPLLWQIIMLLYPKDKVFMDGFQQFYTHDLLNKDGFGRYRFPYAAVFNRLSELMGVPYRMDDVYRTYIQEDSIRQDLDMAPSKESIESWISRYISTLKLDHVDSMLELEEPLFEETFYGH